MTFMSPTGKSVQVSGKSQNDCIESCKNAPELKTPEASHGNDGKVDVLGGLSMAASVAAGGEEAMIHSCVRFCQTSFEWHCFPGDATVVVRGRGRISIAKLEVGDEVLAPRPASSAPASLGSRTPPECCDWELHFDRVLAWVHRDPREPLEVVQIRHALGQVQMSPGHLVFAQRAGSSSIAPVLAKDVRPGDRLLSTWIDGSLSRPEVLETRRSSKKGLFAPLVDGGTIFVDGAAASCYAIPSDIAAAPVFRLAASVADGMAVQSAAHAVFAPLRAFCHAARALRCRQLTHDQQAEALAKADLGVAPSGAHPYAWVMYVLGASFMT